MSSQTTNLNLTDPATSDGVNSTISAIASNFNTVDGEFGLANTTTNRPTTGNYKGRKFYDESINRQIYWDGAKWIDDNGVQAQPYASVSDVELTTTSATTVATLTPAAQGNFAVKVYFRVITATTTVTLTVTWTDGTGAQTNSLVNAVSEATGYYSFSTFVNATPSGAISVSATAGTANQVYVSATIKPE